MRDHGAVSVGARVRDALQGLGERADLVQLDEDRVRHALLDPAIQPLDVDRKSTRLNSSHGYISYAVFCLKKKKKEEIVRHPIDDSEHIDATTHVLGDDES